MITEINEDAGTVTFSCQACHEETTVRLDVIRLSGAECNTVVVGSCAHCSSSIQGFAPLHFADDDSIEPNLMGILVGCLAKKDQFVTPPEADIKNKLKKFYKKNKIDDLGTKARKQAAANKRTFLGDKAEREALLRALSPAVRAEKQAIGAIRSAEKVRKDAEDATTIRNRKLDDFSQNVAKTQQLKALANKRSHLFSADDRKILAEAELSISKVEVDEVQRKLNKLLKRLKADQIPPSGLVRNSP
jgi:hypothetical protein